MAELPVVPPKEAIDFFRSKGLTIGYAWQDVWQEEHARAFTVAKAMSRDLLEDIRGEVDRALADGTTLETFQKDLRPLLEKRGWWGRRSMVDPLTGTQKIVQLGSPRRLKTIFEVNMRSAYAAGRWERAERAKAGFPYLRYVTAGDAKVRPEHQAWHGVVRPIDDAFWNTHYPPCGWNCRCTAVPVSKGMLERRGWSVTEDPPSFPKVPYINPRSGEVISIERGIDPGFNFNVGRAYQDSVAHRPLPPAKAPTPADVTQVSAAARRALKDYTGTAHGEINRILRNQADDGDDRAAAIPTIRELDRLLAAASLPEDATVYRRVDYEFAEELRSMTLAAGIILRDRAYMSTSRDLGWAKKVAGVSPKRRVLMTIFARAGARALDISKVSHYGEEAEVLFARNTRLRVRRWDPETDTFELEVLNDDPAGSLLDGQE